MRNAYKVFNEKYQGKDNFGKMGAGWTILKRQSSGSHGGEYEDNGLLGCKPCSLVEVDRRFRGAFTSVMRVVMEAVRSSEMSMNLTLESVDILTTLL
jgi:hypothetical protein